MQSKKRKELGKAEIERNEQGVVSFTESSFAFHFLDETMKDKERPRHDLLVVVEIGFEVVDQRQHFMLLAEGQEGNESHKRLQHSRVTSHKWTVNPVKEHHQLIAVSAQFGELLQKSNTRMMDFSRAIK